MSYEPIGIQKLSKGQISRLLNGHRVIVKHGNAHNIRASREQHKKITSAGKKQKGVGIMFDPYQIEEHRSSGIFDTIKHHVKHFVKTQANHVRHHLHTEAPRMIREAATHARRFVDDGESFALNRVPGMIDSGFSRVGVRDEPVEEGRALFPAGYGLAKHRKTPLKSRAKTPAKRGTKGKRGCGLWGDVGNIVDRLI